MPLSPILPIPRPRPPEHDEPDPVTRQAIREAITNTGLTEREAQCVIGASKGMSNAQIGAKLFVSEETVKTHMRRVFRKLEAHDRAHAVAIAFRAGVLR